MQGFEFDVDEDNSFSRYKCQPQIKLIKLINFQDIRQLQMGVLWILSAVGFDSCANNTPRVC